MTDFTFMRSGFNNLVEPEEDVLENTAAIILTYMENALKSADIYVKHCNRKSITPEDIKRALMLEAFLNRQRTDMLEKCEEMRETIRAIVNDNYIDEEEGEEKDNEEEEEEEEPFTVSTCQCAICNCFNTIYNKWETFQPQSPIEQAVHNHINKISVWWREN